MERLERAWLAAALVALAGLSTATAQRRSGPAAPLTQSNVQGNLTVTMLVTSSVGIIMGTNGQPQLVSANIIDAADNVSRIQYVHLSPANQHEQRQAGESVKERPPVKRDH